MNRSSTASLVYSDSYPWQCGRMGNDHRDMAAVPSTSDHLHDGGPATHQRRWHEQFQVHRQRRDPGQVLALDGPRACHFPVHRVRLGYYKRLLVPELYAQLLIAVQRHHRPERCLHFHRGELPWWITQMVGHGWHQSERFHLLRGQGCSTLYSESGKQQWITN